MSLFTVLFFFSKENDERRSDYIYDKHVSDTHSLLWQRIIIICLWYQPAYLVKYTKFLPHISISNSTLQDAENQIEKKKKKTEK